MRDSRHSTWEDLPDDGVQFLMLYFSETAPDGNHLREIITGNAWYVRAPTPTGFIYDGTNDEPPVTERRYPGAVLKRGRRMETSAYGEMSERVMASREL